MRRWFRSRRWVVASVVAALAVAGVGASSASAAGSAVDIAKCPPAYSSSEALCAAIIALARASQSTDFEPRDLKLAAPSSVISATMSQSPTTQIQEVNRWRPNTQAWIDAKTRVAGTTGLTTADVASTARWKPVLSRAVGGASGVLLANDVAWWVADGVLYPALGVSESTKQSAYCMRHGNFATDFIASALTHTECGEWRLKQDYEALVGDLLPKVRGSVAGITYIGRTGSATCYRVPSSSWFSPIGLQDMDAATGKWGAVSSGAQAGFYNCGTDGYVLARSLTQAPGLRLVDVNTGAVREQHTYEVDPGNSEWVTRVRCLDGTNRLAISESFQQEKLGAVAVPTAVTLAGCQPVGVDLGLQAEGTGTSGAGGGWSSNPDPVRTGVATGEVSQPVREWMETFPQCMDGSCLLELKKVVGGGMELNCFDAPDSCADWQAETQTSTATYHCYYAQQIVDLAECNVYTRTFVRSNVQQGTGYADPETGKKVTTETGTGTESGSSVTTNPGAATVSMNQGAQDPAENRQCWPTGWGVFNPFEWVYLPVKCALEWAFVPRAAKLEATQTALKLRVINSAPATVVQAVQSWGAVIPTSAECSGPFISLQLPAGASFSGYPLSACEAPASTIATVTRTILAVFFILGGLMAITRYVGRVFGFTGFGGGGDAS